MAGKHYVIATQSGYIVDNVTGYPEEFATKQLAVKALTELVSDAADRCRRSYKTCSVVGTARDGDVQIRVGGRQGYHLWERFSISERAGSRKPRKESALVRELRAASKPVAAHATKKSSAQLDREIASSLAAHAKKRGPRRGGTAESPEMAALREKKANYMRALDYAGNTREQVKEYHRLIDEVSAKMRALTPGSHAAKKSSEVRIPSVAEQVDLATKVQARLGPTVEIGDRRFRVTRFSNEIRFFEQNPRWGAPGDSAHVQILREDLATAPVLPMAYQDRKLAARFVEIVRAALRAVA